MRPATPTMFQTIGKFEIQRLLGKGSMGEVYLGLDPLLDRKVAIKTIQAGPEFQGEGEVRFKREAQALAALSHPRIVTLFDFGKSGDLYYLAMEYLEGKDLAGHIQDNVLGRHELLEALAQACEGLGYAHRHGIVHRDIKPGNIHVAAGPDGITAKLLDFGVASVDRSSLTQQGVWMGTIGYMAPEYLDTGHASPSSDLFAVGAIMYEILTGGRKAFTGESTTAILSAILQRPPEPLTEAEKLGVSPSLLEVMERALAKDPAHRFPHAEALASALREALKAPVPPPLSLAPRATLTVGRGGGHCLSLRVALRQAQPGSVITLLPGHYKEAVQLDRTVTIQGEGDPDEILLEAPAGSALTVEAPDCVLRGFTLLSLDASPAVEHRCGQAAFEGCRIGSLRVAQGAGAALQDCVVAGTHPGPAIQLETGAALRARNTRVTHPRGLGLRLDSGAECIGESLAFENTLAGGLEMAPGSSAQLVRCSFQGSRFAGLLALRDASANLEACLFTGHEGAGVHGSGARLHLTACRLADNPGMGLSVTDGGQARLQDCEFEGNAQPGLLLHRGASAQVSASRFEGGPSLGIACYQDAALILEGSTVRGHAQGGILVGPGAAAPDIRDCTLGDPVLA